MTLLFLYWHIFNLTNIFRYIFVFMTGVWSSVHLTDTYISSDVEVPHGTGAYISSDVEVPHGTGAYISSDVEVPHGTDTYISSDVEVPLPGLRVLTQELVDQGVELHQTAILTQVILQQNNYNSC